MCKCDIFTHLTTFFVPYHIRHLIPNEGDSATSLRSSSSSRCGSSFYNTANSESMHERNRPAAYVSESEDDEGSTAHTDADAASDDNPNFEEDITDASITKTTILRLGGNDPSFVELDVRCKSLSGVDATAITHHLPTNTHVRTLRLHCGSNPLHLVAFHEVASTLRYNVTMEHIKVQEAVISRVTSGWLLPAFARKPNLARIGMTRCKFVRSGLATLVVAMQHNKGSIRELAFRSCDWDTQDLNTVSSSLPLLDLRLLSLIDMDTGHPDAFSYLFQNIEQCRHLVHLDLSRNALDSSVLLSLAKALTVQNLISSLALSSCGLDNAKTMKLVTSLRTYAKL
jgi:hypothetical protein